MRIAQSVRDLIGHTPILHAQRLQEKTSSVADLLLKLEFFNPGGSIKDRIGWSILEEAEKTGELKPGAVIIEPTSGNTGIGLAIAAKVKGYRLILTMPETMSLERRQLLASYGAELILTPGKDGMNGSVQKAEALAKELPSVFLPRQFDNPVNWQTHYCSTAEEIWQDTAGEIDFLVAGVGTGGTITGCAKKLKEYKKDICVVAVEPASSPLLSQGYAGAHGLQGIGANFVPSVLQRELLDEILPITDEKAKNCCRLLADTEGILVGISAGAAIGAALEIADKKQNTGKKIVVIIPDGGQKYLSMNLFTDA